MNESDTEVELTEIELKENTLRIQVAHPRAVNIINSLIKMLEELGGENYVSMCGISQATGKRYEIIIKHLHGMLPAEKVVKLQATVDAQASEIEKLKSTIAGLHAHIDESGAVK